MDWESRINEQAQGNIEDTVISGNSAARKRSTYLIICTLAIAGLIVCGLWTFSFAKSFSNKGFFGSEYSDAQAETVELDKKVSIGNLTLHYPSDWTLNDAHMPDGFTLEGEQTHSLVGGTRTEKDWFASEIGRSIGLEEFRITVRRVTMESFSNTTFGPSRETNVLWMSSSLTEFEGLSDGIPITGYLFIGSDKDAFYYVEATIPSDSDIQAKLTVQKIMGNMVFPLRLW